MEFYGGVVMEEMTARLQAIWTLQFKRWLLFNSMSEVRLCSHRHRYEYGSGFPFMARRNLNRMSGTFTVICTSR